MGIKCVHVYKWSGMLLGLLRNVTALIKAGLSQVIYNWGVSI